MTNGSTTINRLRSVSNALRVRIRELLLGCPRRSPNPYATHVPYLVGVVAITGPRRVLELGSGIFSTLTLMDSTVCPSIESLDSFEDDLEWFQSMGERLGGDRRANLQLVQTPLASAVESMDLDRYDLILVDNSRTCEERTRTLRSVFSRWKCLNVVMVHDFEIADYRRAASCPLKRITFKAYSPCTGVLWREGRIPRGPLRDLQKLVAAHSRTLDVADASSWRRLFERKGLCKSGS